VNDRFRHKGFFWGFVLLLLALTTVPSAVLMEAFNDYYRFLTGLQPSVLRPSPSASTLRHEAVTAGQTTLHFVEFRVKAPKAKNVEVVGDFNGWKQGTLPLQRQGSGHWELLLPLPAGRYRFHYLIDRQAVFDSKGPVRTVP
jgi:hypothetical protein